MALFFPKTSDTLFVSFSLSHLSSCSEALLLTQGASDAAALVAATVSGEGAAVAAAGAAAAPVAAPAAPSDAAAAAPCALAVVVVKPLGGTAHTEAKREGSKHTLGRDDGVK